MEIFIFRNHFIFYHKKYFFIDLISKSETLIIAHALKPFLAESMLRRAWYKKGNFSHV